MLPLDAVCLLLRVQHMCVRLLPADATTIEIHSDQRRRTVGDRQLSKATAQVFQISCWHRETKAFILPGKNKKMPLNEISHHLDFCQAVHMEGKAAEEEYHYRFPHYLRKRSHLKVNEKIMQTKCQTTRGRTRWVWTLVSTSLPLMCFVFKVLALKKSLPVCWQ